MSGRSHDQVVWFKYDRVEFRCLEQYIVSRHLKESNPLALSAFAFLFHSLGKKSLLYEALSRLRDEINQFVDIQDSAMRLRNCLVISAYVYLCRKAKQELEVPGDAVKAHLDYAERSKWFNDPRLAAVVAKLPLYTQYGPKAYEYLSGHVREWMQQDNTLGVLCYCVAQDQAASDEVINYLLSKQWSEVGLENLCWALLAVGALAGEAHELELTQRAIVERIYGILGTSHAMSWAIRDHRADVSELTTFELAFAAFALRRKRFNQLIGFPSYQEDVLLDLIQLRDKLLLGGVILPKRVFVFFQLATLALLLGGAWWLIQAIGIVGLYAVLLELVVLALLSSFGYWYLNKRRLSAGALSEIFRVEVQSLAESTLDEHS